MQAVGAIPILCLLGAGSAGASALRPFSARVVHSGHSLTDPIVPILDVMVSVAGQQESRGRVMSRSTIPGSPMEWRWNHGNEASPDARQDIADYDVLVITERVPLSNTMEWHASKDMALKWFNHAWESGNKGTGADTILYATWIDTNSGEGFENIYNDPEGHLSFRERLPLEMARWQEIANYVNKNRPIGSSPMRIIPGPLLMIAVYDSIIAGQAPRLKRIEDLFSDTIHINAVGAYLIALAHLAVIYGFDPRELSSALAGLDIPDPETSDWMKLLVHNVLRDYPDSGYL